MYGGQGSQAAVPCKELRELFPRLQVEGTKRSAPAACASLPLCSCLPVVCADCYECHHLVCHVDIIIFS